MTEAGALEDWPEIEYDQSYPVDEEFAAFTATEPNLSFKVAGAWLLRELPRSPRRARLLVGSPKALPRQLIKARQGEDGLPASCEARERR